MRSGFKILRHVFTKAMLRLDTRTDYRLRTDVLWRVYRNGDKKETRSETSEKTLAP